MSAEVHSIQALADLQAALGTFGEQAKDALAGCALEIRRVQGWLEGQLQHWQAEIRRAEEAVFLARQELARRRLMRVGDRRPDTTEQEKVLRRAQAWLDHVQEKSQNTRRWLRQLPDAVEEYDGQARAFQDWLETDLPRMAGLLERKIRTLHEYADLAPPRGETP